MANQMTVEDTAHQATRPAPLLMRRDKILVLTILALTAGGTIALQFLRASSSEESGVSHMRVIKPLSIGQLRGISLQIQDGDDNAPFDKYIREIASTGANSINIVVTAFQQNCGSSSIFIEARKTPSRKRLKELVQVAHDEGMKVVLMPIVLLAKPRAGEWRGKINPGDGHEWDDWWTSYSDYILYYADFAQQAKVDVFMVGSELISTETFTDRWVNLIGQVRKHYHGLMSYSSNWDHYMVVKFWDKLDIVGMTTYYDLCGTKQPTMDVLMDTWKGIKADIINWQQTVDKPILFTEVGWPNQASAARYPWDYYRDMEHRDPELQKRCFEAFFQTWAKEKGMGGYLVWEWRNWDGQDTKPLTDPGYCPKDKPAMEVIQRYFELGGPSTRPTSQPSGESPVATAPAGIGNSK